jgi:hypothetical protein
MFGWGKGTVEALAEHIRKRQPDARGFSAQNLWRMRQFFEVYRDQPNLAALLRDLSRTNNLMILGKCQRAEKQEFYLRRAAQQKWSSRELAQSQAERDSAPKRLSRSGTNVPAKKKSTKKVPRK